MQAIPDTGQRKAKTRVCNMAFESSLPATVPAMKGLLLRVSPALCLLPAAELIQILAR